MPDFRTKNGARFDQPEIVVHLSDGTDLEPVWLVDYFENAISSGTRFKAGETVQVGWMLALLKEAGDGGLELWEPQFDSMPIQWTRGANNTLRHLILQKTLANLLGCEPVFASLQEPGIASRDFLAASDEFIMARDSDWTFRNAEEIITSNTPCGYKSLYELSLYCQQIIPFLALPDGAQVIKLRDVTVVEYGGKRLSSATNETFRKIAAAEILV